MGKPTMATLPMSESDDNLFPVLETAKPLPAPPKRWALVATMTGASFLNARFPAPSSFHLQPNLGRLRSPSDQQARMIMSSPLRTNYDR